MMGTHMIIVGSFIQKCIKNGTNPRKKKGQLPKRKKQSKTMYLMWMKPESGLCATLQQPSVSGEIIYYPNQSQNEEPKGKSSI